MIIIIKRKRRRTERIIIIIRRRRRRRGRRKHQEEIMILKKGLVGNNRGKTYKIAGKLALSASLKKPKKIKNRNQNQAKTKKGCFKITFLHAETQPTIFTKFSFFQQLTPYPQQSCVLLKTQQVFSAEHSSCWLHIVRTFWETPSKPPFPKKRWIFGFPLWPLKSLFLALFLI